MASPLTSRNSPPRAYNAVEGFMGRVQNASGNAQRAFAGGATAPQLRDLANTLFGNRASITVAKGTPRLLAYGKTAQADATYDVIANIDGFLVPVNAALADIDTLMKGAGGLVTWSMPELTPKSFTAAELAALRTNLLAIANY